MAKGGVAKGGMHGRGACLVVGGVCMAKGRQFMVGGMCGGGACVAGEMATAADGTHPTGMHSCLLLLRSLANHKPVCGNISFLLFSFLKFCELIVITTYFKIVPTKDIFKDSTYLMHCEI